MTDRWRDKAACLTVDPDAMFPEPSDFAGIVRARLVCSGCPVARICSDYAVTTRQQAGVWGGKLRREKTH